MLLAVAAPFAVAALTSPLLGFSRVGRGSTRHDWLSKVGRAMEAHELAAPLDEMEAMLRSWSLGKTWPQRRAEWRRRLGSVARDECSDPEVEVIALLKLLLDSLQPVLSGERAQPQGHHGAPPAQRSPSNPFKERLQAMQHGGGSAQPHALAVASAAGEAAAAAVEAGVHGLYAEVAIATTHMTDESGTPLEILPASSVSMLSGDGAGGEREEESEEEEDDDDGEVGQGDDIINHAELATEAEGWQLHRSKQSPTGYTNVLRRGEVFALRKSKKYRINESTT